MLNAVLLAAMLGSAPVEKDSNPVALSERSESNGPAADAPTAVAQPSAQNRKASFFRLFGIGAATTMVITPVSMALGAWIGTWSSSIAILVPSLLLLIIVPPLVTTLVEWALGNALWGPGTFKIGWSLAMGLVVQLALVVISVFVGVPGATIPGIAVFTAIDMVLLGGVSSGLMWVTRVEPSATLATRMERDQGGSVGSMDLPRAPAAALGTVRF
jgi:hypothetical protein